MKAVAGGRHPGVGRQGITVEWWYKGKSCEDSGCEDANIELAEEGCDLIINNSYGFEAFTC